MPIRPTPVNLVVVVLLFATILSACDLSEEEKIAHEKQQVKKPRARHVPTVVPALGIRG